MKYVSIDLETTGLDPQSQHILEFGAVVDDLVVQDSLDSLPTYHCYFDDFLQDDVYVPEEYAMNMNSAIIDKIVRPTGESKILSYWEFRKDFREFLLSCGFLSDEKGYLKLVAAGKNFSSFDKRFIDNRNLLGDSIRFHQRVLDPTIFYLDIGVDLIPPNLAECLKRAGMPNTVHHTAVEDSLDVVKLLRHSLLGTNK